MFVHWGVLGGCGYLCVEGFFVGGGFCLVCLVCVFFLFLFLTVPSGGDPSCWSLSFSVALSFFPHIKCHIHHCVLGRRI